MGEPLDLYCERIAPGLWGEPFNALSNLAFFLAAHALWRRARGKGERDGDVTLLSLLVALIGVGSTLFHTFADTVTHRLDTTPILVF